LFDADAGPPPLADQPPVDIFELVRLIAVTRVALPKARVRLAAGRTRISREGQALCFFAGANSIFYGDKLLTAKNPATDVDVSLLRELGLHVESIPNDEGMTKFEWQSDRLIFVI
jgi:biotin synthase